ncbi:MAG: glycosyltransferase family 2 protein [Phycisphaerales bacterium]
MRLGVVIPVYNERELLARSLDRLEATPPPKTPDGGACERVIYLIDDGSTDGTREVVESLAQRPGVRTSLAERNQGKGAALRRGFAMALEDACDVVIVQDADLEYDPADHAIALAPILDGRADAVIGTRFLGQTHRVLYYWHAVGNKLITLASNTFSNLNLTDIECGTKAFTRDVLSRLVLNEDRFGIEPEIVARLARLRLPVEGGAPRRVRIYEVPVSYAGRTYEEGKKIGWRDALSALRCIITYNLL